MEEWKGRKDRRLIEENRSVTTEGREKSVEGKSTDVVVYIDKFSFKRY